VYSILFNSSVKFAISVTMYFYLMESYVSETDCIVLSRWIVEIAITLYKFKRHIITWLHFIRKPNIYGAVSRNSYIDEVNVYI
jgi:hypothetical protein